MSDVSARLVEQRIRNRIIEYLEIAASFEVQRDYARAVPYVHVPYEVINRWEDWVGVDPRTSSLPSEVYSAPEWEALKDFQLAWETAASALPDDYPALDDVQTMPEWSALRDEAIAALAVFAQRGVFPDDHEVDWHDR